MIGWTIFGLAVVYYAKPAYWMGRLAYLHFTDQPNEAEIAAKYNDKLKKWAWDTWALVLWKKDDI